GVVGRVGHDRDAVVADLELEELDAVGGAGLLLLGLDLRRGVVDVGLAVAEQLEAVTGAGAVDGDVDVAVLGVEALGDVGGDRLDRRGAGDDDRARELAALGAGALGRGALGL